MRNSKAAGLAKAVSVRGLHVSTLWMVSAWTGVYSTVTLLARLRG